MAIPSSSYQPRRDSPLGPLRRVRLQREMWGRERTVVLSRLPQLDLDFAQFKAFSAPKCLIGHSREA